VQERVRANPSSIVPAKNEIQTNTGDRGKDSSAEPGATIRLNRRLRVGGAYYRFLPAGPQKAYNGIQNFFLQPNGSITVGDITHDHGETAFVRININRFLYLEPGYVRSEQLHDNAATFRVA
jgi:hypothetical protein